MEQEKRRRWVISGLAIALAVMVISSLLVWKQRDNALSGQATAQAVNAVAVVEAATAQEKLREAQRQAAIARAGELAAQSLYAQEKDLPVSLLLGIEAFKTFDTPVSRSALLQSAEAHPRLLRFLDIKATSIYRIVYSPDGKMLAVTGCGKMDELGHCVQSTIELWDVSNGQPIGQITTATTANALGYGLVFSPNGKTFAVGHGDGSITLWDLATQHPIGQPLRSGDTGGISHLAFSPDGKMLASGSSLGSGGVGGPINLWDVDSGQLIWSPPGIHFGPYSLAFSPDGKRLLYLGWGNTFIGWDVATHAQVEQTDLQGKSSLAGDTALSPDGRKAAGALTNGEIAGSIVVWDTKTGQPISQPFMANTCSCGPLLVFSPDGKTLASGCSDGDIILWDVTQQAPLGERFEGQTDSIWGLAFSPDGATLAARGWNGSVALWVVSSQPPLSLQRKGSSREVDSIAFNPDGKILASGNGDTTIQLWDVASRQPIGQPLVGHSGSVSSVAFSPDGNILASGSSDGTVILWNVATGRPVGKPLARHPHDDLMDTVRDVAFSPDGSILASGSYDGDIILWDVPTGQPIGVPLAGHAGSVNSVAFSPDGKVLASAGCGSYDQSRTCVRSEIIFWNVASGQQIGQPILDNTPGVGSVVLSPDGKTLAAATGYTGVTMWEVATKQSVGQLLTGEATFGVSSMAFSPDSKTLAGGGYGTIYLWDVTTHQLLGQLSTTRSTVASIAFSPDGRTLASGSVDGSLALWKVEPQMWIEKTCQRAGRNFTQSEWQQYFFDEPYRLTCPQWPAGE